MNGFVSATNSTPGVTLGLALGVSLVVALPLSAEERAVDFVRDIKPILSDKCFACHGPDSSNREAGLRLDRLEGATADLGGYAAIVAGKPEDSELVARITSSDPDLKMPPAEGLKQLDASEIKLLEQWIEQGAQWGEHWAYQPPVRPELSTVQASQGKRRTPSGWSSNFVDTLLLSKLHAEGLEPSGPATRRTLIRRLSQDIRGLPPTTEEVREFLEDDSPSAYRRLVDRYLADPAFGERMAVYWLDLVRYADTVGYHGDQDVSVSPFRDYVIGSFNSNKPFDQFTLEQLAGDLLENPSPEQLIASGYNKLGMMSAEGGVQPEEYLTKYAADRVRTLSGAWMGSTVGCAECHDHKFDPFSTRDFYSFAAFFADIKERGLYSGANRDGAWGPKIDVPHPALPELVAPIDAEIASLKKQMDAPNEAWDAAQSQWEKEVLRGKDWQVAMPSSATSTGGVKLTIGEQGHVLASGKDPATATYKLNFTVSNQPAAIAIQTIPGEAMPSGGAGRAGNGNFVITEVLVNIDGQPIQRVKAIANHEQADSNAKNPFGGWKAEGTIDGDVHGGTYGWAVLPRATESNTLAIVLGSVESANVESEDVLAERRIEIVIKQNHPNPKHTLGSFRVMFANEWNDELPSYLPEKVRQALVSSVSPSVEGREVVRDYFRASSSLTERLRAKIASLESRREKLVQEHTRTMLVTQTVEPREMRVLPRGNWMDKSGAVVQPAIPDFLALDEPAGPDQPRGEAASIASNRRLTRVDLARWLCSPENPLTSRVFVNRLWKIYFGDGLSSSLDDFGAQGRPPEHARLLDALAVEFVESGWDIKHMVRLLVTSSTYQQSSIPQPGALERDPYNRLFARQARYRLPAEMVRDNALAVSGLLIREIGGRSVKPYQPEGLYRHLNFPRRTYVADQGSEQFRRGVYTHWQRQFLHPALQSMDAPAREECTAERPRSNTPLAALVLLNDPSYVESARQLAQQILVDIEPKTQLEELFFNVLGRQARSEEIKVLERLLESNMSQFRDAPDQAERLISIGQSPRDVTIPAVNLAAWTNVARAVLNMHETITRN